MSATVTVCPNCGTKNRVPVASTGRVQCASCHAPLPWLVDASDADFSAAVDTDQLVLVDLWAPWCGPCRQVSPLLEKLAAERAGKLKLVKVNVDENPATQAKFGVQAIPTLLLFSGGKQVGVQRGAVPLPQLRQWVDAHA